MVPGDPVTFVFDPSRPESALARARVNDVLQRAAGRQDPVRTADTRVTEPGSRYIDFLVPGLLGMNLMSGSLWGVGFVIVDMRVKKLLKRLAATPMTRTDFLWSIAGSRLLFMLPELVVILGAGVLLFGMPVRGSWLAILTLAVLGAGVVRGPRHARRMPGAAHRDRVRPDERSSWCRCGCCRASSSRRNGSRTCCSRSSRRCRSRS